LGASNSWARDVSGVACEGMGMVALAAYFLGVGKARATLGRAVLVPRMAASSLSAVSSALPMG
jgi:hypothetical protein